MSLIRKPTTILFEVIGYLQCGNSKFHPLLSQVLNFVQKFADLLPDYEVACEHEHSNCVLIAHKKVEMLQVC